MSNKNDFNDCELSEEQKKIVYSDINQNQKIEACAGSGKTTTLIYRVKYLINNKIKPQKIILTTFNIEAAKNLNKKAKQVLETKDQTNLKIVNIDKFIYEIYESNLKINDPLQKKYIKQSLTYISSLVLKYLSSDQGRKILNQYSHFFFDEFQDINDIQYNILMQFCKNNCKIIAIGDEAQNIYSFRNSRLEFIQKKIDDDVEKYQNQKIHIYNLSINFRSQSKIIEFCNQILINIKKSHQMQSAKQSYQEEEKPIVKIYQSKQEQYETIIEEIYDLVQKHKYQLSDIAILSPRNEEIKHIQAILERKNYEVRKNSQNQTIIQQEQQQEEIPYRILQKNSNLLLLNYSKTFDDDDIIAKLTLSTFHSSKGLEWKVVYIVGINDKHFPRAFLAQSNQENTKEKLIEILRTFYVACTRSIDLLNLSFVKDDNKVEFICRFMSQINEKYFQKDEYFKKKNIAKMNLQSYNQQLIKQGENEFQQNLSKTNHKESSLFQIISNFSFNDFEKINQYLQDLEQLELNINQTKKKVTYSLKDLKPNNNCQSLLSYLDLLLQRTIAEKFNLNSGYRYQKAEKILFCIDLDKKQQAIFNEFKCLFSEYCEKTNNYQQFLEILLTQYQRDSNRIQKINNSKQEICSIYETIKSYLKDYKIKFKDIQHHTKKYFPDNFQHKQQFYECYKKFINKEHKFLSYLNPPNQKQQISKTQFIYVLSKLDLIYEGKQECLYRNDSEDIDIYHKFTLKYNIERFLKIIESKTKDNKDFNIEVKKEVKDQGQLYGIVDLLVGDTIYKFVYNFQEVYPIQIAHQDIIQQLAFALILNEQGAKITQISFYNIIEEDKIDYSIQKFIENPVISKDYLEFLKYKASSLEQEFVQTSYGEQQIEQQQMPNLNLANEINNYQLQSNQNQSQQILQFQEQFDSNKDSLKEIQQDKSPFQIKEQQKNEIHQLNQFQYTNYQDLNQKSFDDICIQNQFYSYQDNTFQKESKQKSFDDQMLKKNQQINLFETKYMNQNVSLNNYDYNIEQNQIQQQHQNQQDQKRYPFQFINEGSQLEEDQKLNKFHFQFQNEQNMLNNQNQTVNNKLLIENQNQLFIKQAKQNQLFQSDTQNEEEKIIDKFQEPIPYTNYYCKESMNNQIKLITQTNSNNFGNIPKFQNQQSLFEESDFIQNQQKQIISKVTDNNPKSDLNQNFPQQAGQFLKTNVLENIPQNTLDNKQLDQIENSNLYQKSNNLHLLAHQQVNQDKIIKEIQEQLSKLNQLVINNTKNIIEILQWLSQDINNLNDKSVNEQIQQLQISLSKQFVKINYQKIQLMLIMYTANKSYSDFKKNELIQFLVDLITIEQNNKPINKKNIKFANQIDSYPTSDEDLDLDEQILKIKQGLAIESQIEQCNDWYEIRGDVAKILKKRDKPNKRQFEQTDESIQNEQQVYKQLKQ
ncbi:UvrD/REP helicase family protein (macronuclear) [Tetrahymena thermophila SB210]|uniref:UvrD/REP helicase family protein n=1 Tax=Tetrahymena thermophila (strain SB210) TaxID=312017 RepID=Q245I3_TETTS|nr:UvrD/REP helicase family protein [Tetrahymena thermophila SB210]EAS03381.2 UvrD/REP helicase family protein [Tetrahymena thermophila SB210]|eukprot:XP_001023626.2 UvrD/REP helicase family protein [Tetrahymena thermophila SB210]